MKSILDKLQANKSERVELMNELYTFRTKDLHWELKATAEMLFSVGQIGFTQEQNERGYINIEMKISPFQLEVALKERGFIKTESSPKSQFWKKDGFFVSPIYSVGENLDFLTQDCVVLFGNRN